MREGKHGERSSRPRIELFEEKLGDLELARGNYDAALKAYRSAREERRQLGKLTPGDEGRYLFRLASLALKIGNYGEAIESCDRGIRLVGDLDPGLSASFQALAGLIFCSQGRLDDAQLRVERGLKKVSGHDLTSDSERRAYASLLRTQGNVLLGRGKPNEAVAEFEESRTLWEMLADSWEHSIALFNLGEAHALAGDYNTALRFLDDAEKAKAGIGDRWGLAYTYLTRGRIRFDQRQWHRAWEEAGAGLHLAEEIGDPKITALLRILTARITAEQGEEEDAEAILETALVESQKAAAVPEVLEAKLALASSLRRRGELGRARTLAEESLALASTLSSKLSLAAAFLELGRIEGAQGDQAEAKAHLESALELAHEVGNPFREMEILAAQADLRLG